MKKTRKFPFKGLVARWRQWSLQERILLTVSSVIFLFYAASLIYPFVWALINSGKTLSEFYDNQFSLPKNWGWQNYIHVFELQVRKTSLVGMIGNSLWVTIIATGVGIISSICTAYACSKYRFRGSKIFYSIAIFIQVIPLVGNMPATYKLAAELGMVDNPALIWLMWGGGFGFAFITLYSYFQSVSWGYAEAAFIDGANHLQVLLRIMLPQALPAIVSIAIINFIGTWNDYMTPYLYLPSYPTLSVGLYLIETEAQVSNSSVKGAPLYFSAILLSMIPIIVIYCCFQKVIMQNTVAGGLKG